MGKLVGAACRSSKTVTQARRSPPSFRILIAIDVEPPTQDIFQQERVGMTILRFAPGRASRVTLLVGLMLGFHTTASFAQG